MLLVVLRVLGENFVSVGGFYLNVLELLGVALLFGVAVAEEGRHAADVCHQALTESPVSAGDTSNDGVGCHFVQTLLDCLIFNSKRSSVFICNFISSVNVIVCLGEVMFPS